MVNKFSTKIFFHLLLMSLKYESYFIWSNSSLVMVIATICLFAKLAVLASVQGKDSHKICCINCCTHNTIQWIKRRRSSCVTVSYNFDWREQKRANRVEGAAAGATAAAAAEIHFAHQANFSLEKMSLGCARGAMMRRRVQGREAGGAGGGALRWLRCSGQPRTSDCCDLGWGVVA
jgi:hypothetical protein